MCIDIDNVIASTDEVIRFVIKRTTGGRVDLQYEDVVSFNYYECRDRNGEQITKDEWEHAHRVFSTEYIEEISPVDNAVEALEELRSFAKIHLVTSRLRDARAATVTWLDKHGFPPHDLHFAADRRKHFVLWKLAALIEDDYEQAALCARERSRPAFLIAHPWNSRTQCDAHIVRVADWRELLPLVRNLAEAE